LKSESAYYEFKKTLNELWLILSKDKTPDSSSTGLSVSNLLTLSKDWSQIVGQTAHT